MGLDFGELYEQGLTHLNVGTGSEISIEGLASLLSELIGYQGTINYDDSMPDGTPRKGNDDVVEIGRAHV